MKPVYYVIWNYEFIFGKGQAASQDGIVDLLLGRIPKNIQTRMDRIEKRCICEGDIVVDIVTEDYYKACKIMHDAPEWYSFYGDDNNDDGDLYLVDLASNQDKIYRVNIDGAPDWGSWVLGPVNVLKAKRALYLELLKKRDTVDFYGYKSEWKDVSVREYALPELIDVMNEEEICFY
jgi:hypothetical protein